MNITNQQIQDYYNSLTEEQKFEAFKNMIVHLSEIEEIRFFAEENKMYWVSCGDSIFEI